MKHVVMLLLNFVFVSAIAATTEKCAIFCNHEKSGHDIDTKNKNYLESSSLPHYLPKDPTTINCFKPILACLGKLNECGDKKIEVLWNPNKESQLPAKTIVATCEESKNLGKILKADLGLQLFSQSTGTFTIKGQTNQIYYYNAVTGE